MNLTPKLDPNAGLYLALGGGAARGFAHLGILIALERAGIPIAGICGTSVGALVGSCYALTPNAEVVAQDFISYILGAHFNQVRYSFMKNAEKQASRANSIRDKLRQGLLLGLSYTKGGIISFNDFRTEIGSLVPHKTFKELQLPFFATSVDLTENREVLIGEGFLRSAVMASCAIPGAFPPIQAGTSIYVDGGWMNCMPVNPLLQFGAEKVLAIDVTNGEPVEEVNTKRGTAVLGMANKASFKRLHELQVERASLIWRPPVEDIHWADFVNIEQTIEIGMKYAEEHMHELHSILEPDNSEPWWRRVARRIAGPKKSRPSHYPFALRSIWDIKQAGKL